MLITSSANSQVVRPDGVVPAAPISNSENLSLIDDLEEGFVAIFNGKDLDGWVQKNGTANYEVVDGTIMGRTAVGSPNSFLCSVKKYADFDLRFDVKVDVGLNSGVQIRSLSKPGFNSGRVHGPQVEIESDLGERDTFIPKAPGASGSVRHKPSATFSTTMIGTNTAFWPKSEIPRSAFPLVKRGTGTALSFSSTEIWRGRPLTILTTPSIERKPMAACPPAPTTTFQITNPR